MPALALLALTTLGVSAEIAAVVSGPLVAVLIGGLSLGLGILFGPEVPKPEAGRNPIKQAIPPRIRILGRRRSAGAHMLYHSYKGSTFHGVIAVCEGPANEFTKVWLHDDQVEVIANTVQGIESSSANRYGDGKVKIYTRDGVAHETAYTPANSPPFKTDLVTQDIWTDAMRGDGIASVCTIASDAGPDQQAQRFPFGIPITSVEVDATKVFDPRAQGGVGSAGGSGHFGSAGSGISGAGGSQDWSDPDTWTYAGNDNPILQAVWFLTAPIEQGGIGLDMEECFSTVLDDLAVQADICDDEVNLKAGGTEKRYRAYTMYRFSDNPGDVLGSILATMDGCLLERGDGAFELRAGKWRDDDFEIIIKDRHIISLTVQRFRPDEDEVTGVIVTYNSVVHDHQSIDAPVWPRDAYMGGEDHRIRKIDVIQCPSGTQAQRLSKRVAEYEMARITGTAVLNMYGVLLLDRRGVTIQCTDDPDLNDCKARLTRCEPNLMDGTVTIEFQVIDPDEVDAWDPATEEGPLQPVVTVPVDDSRSIPTNLVAAATLVAGVTGLEVQFDPGTSGGTEYDLRQRIADTGGGVPGLWQVQRITDIDKEEDDRWIIAIGNPIINASVEVQVRPPSSAAWSSSAFVDTTSPGPGHCYNLSSNLSGSNVQVHFRSPNSTNYDHYRVYRATHGAGFGAASDISGAHADTPNTNTTYTDTAPGSGNYDYYVSAETAANLSSLTNGPTNTVVP